MIKNTKGITLIELLAAISLGTIVLILAYQLFFQGLLFSKTVNYQTLLQQESNNIIANMTKIHQISNAYTITLDKNPEASIVTIDGKDLVTFQNKNFLYTIEINGYRNSNYSVQPKNTDLFVAVTITAKKDKKQAFSSKATISRLK